MSRLRQIITLGGGGFSMEPRNPLLDDYILGLAGVKRPRVCFIGTASGDSQVYIDRFYRAFPRSRAVASHLPLFNRDRRLDPAKHLLGQDVIYVGGGNTANLLAVWRLHGVDRILRRAWREGIVLCGISAGMNCWFEASVTDSFGQLRPLNDGLGLLPGSACPHYDGEKDRRPTYRRFIRTRQLPAGYAADDGVALHFVGCQLHSAVSSRRGGMGYRVEISQGKPRELALPTRFLER